MLRQPIIATLGHVDHGKTSLLDKIRQTSIAAKEVGGITQAIGTTEIPAEAIKEICGPLLQRFNFSINIPGLLFIDTPGHEAFTTLRRRGGSIADIAILVIDIVEGIMPQTEESIEILKETKTPFVVAVNKIDRIQGWLTKDAHFLDNYQQQTEHVQQLFEQDFYKIIADLNKYDFSADRFDRVTDFRKTVAAVPLSAKTGEGISELLAVLIGLSQQFLKEQLVSGDKSEGMVLEVKEATGFGTVIDCIIYNGSAGKNDFLVIGGKSPMIAKVRSLLVPDPMRDIRMEKKFHSVDNVNAAAGVRIAAPGLDKVVAGSPIRTAKTFEEAEQLLDELEKEKAEIEVHSENDGLILKADTTGSLEALMHIFHDYPIRVATIGNITKYDIIDAEANTDRFHKIVIGFNTAISEEANVYAKDRGVKIIESNIIYRLKEEYEVWIEQEKELLKKKELEGITRPGKIRILPECIFRASNPAIVGCEVLGGILKPGYKLLKEERGVVGEIKQIQSQGQNIEEAKIGDKIAVSIVGPIVGRQIDESDVLYTEISSDEYKRLRSNEQFLTENEKAVLEEIKEIKKKHDRRWGL